jgi:hypothetical protein
MLIVFLRLLARPHFTTNQVFTTKSVNEFQDLIIMCSAIGTPTPNITWIKMQGANMVIKSQGVENATLSIPNITRHEGGTYICLATNNPHEVPVFRNTTVSVLCKYRTASTCIGVSYSYEYDRMFIQLTHTVRLLHVCRFVSYFILKNVGTMYRD